jgi:hypothetical protein
MKIRVIENLTLGHPVRYVKGGLSRMLFSFAHHISMKNFPEVEWILESGHRAEVW